VKRVLKWVGVVVALLVVLAGAVWYTAFGNNKPVVEGPVVDGVETVRDGFTNVFLVDTGPDKVALVDAGNDKSGKAVLAALARRNLAPAAVEAILLTHGHRDHIAACKLFPGAQVYAMEPEASLIGDAATVTHPLRDGETVSIGDLRVEAFSVPGHTPGSGVYLARGVLFFGDSAGASKTGDVMQAVRLFSKDPGLNVASLKSLTSRLAPRRAEIKAMAFGHTGSLEGFEPLAAFAARD
jgi:glyoxylase-like metal-dependent hydrolase (beta-lactamase superfamily II)